MVAVVPSTDTLEWFKSSYSGGNTTECVEAARLPGRSTAIRDSKSVDGPRLVFPYGAWAGFVGALRHHGVGGRLGA
ncbi:DUF397 domain-containing protein [Streptomyces sp. NPDC101062]|uniref:DUF397 domain-containing protein n=1 Tax=unclassified Streptomyces TaxID=2593676 RepID=UPI002E79FC11|nr:DUF397 domain-containing protein [Streptomyces sp. JV176]MEE1802398.1 DUF397 domain-containing protein [Streptomyces sp. JV176]